MQKYKKVYRSIKKCRLKIDCFTIENAIKTSPEKKGLDSIRTLWRKIYMEFILAFLKEFKSLKILI